MLCRQRTAVLLSSQSAYSGFHVKTRCQCGEVIYQVIMALPRVCFAECSEKKGPELKEPLRDGRAGFSTAPGDLCGKRGPRHMARHVPAHARPAATFL